MPQLQFEAPELAPARRGFQMTLPALPFRPVGTKKLAELTGQLALMLRTGTPLIESIEALRTQTQDERLLNILDSIKGEISGGSTLAKALSAHPRVFDGFYVNAIEAGEASGLLADVFTRLEVFLRKRVEIRSNIVTALIYPAIIGVIATLAVTFVIIFVLPKFIRIFEKAGVALPVPTRMLLAFSGFAADYWYILLAAVVALPPALFFFLKSARGSRIFDFLLLRLPLVGSLTQMIESSLLLRTLGTLLGSGVGLMGALLVARNASRNSFFRDFVDDVSLGVTRGGALTIGFEKSDLMAPSVKAMVATGERTGSLALVMNEVADYLDIEADRRMKRLSALVEPLMIIIMGVVVGFIAISILMPLFQLSGLAAGK